MNRLDFLIEWYHKENERHISLDDSLNIPIGIVTGLFAFAFFLLKEFNFTNENDSIIFYSFLFFVLLSLSFCLLVVYNLFMSYNNLFKGYEYEGLPYASQLDTHYKSLKVYAEENSEILDDDVTKDTIFEGQLIEMISLNIDTNVRNNDLKSEYLHRAKQFLFFCIISSFICTIPFIFNYQKHNEKVYKIQIENLDKINNKIESIDVKNLNVNNYESKQESTQKAASTTTTTTTCKEINKGRENSKSQTK